MLRLINTNHCSFDAYILLHKNRPRELVVLFIADKDWLGVATELKNCLILASSWNKPLHYFGLTNNLRDSKHLYLFNPTDRTN